MLLSESELFLNYFLTFFLELLVVILCRFYFNLKLTHSPLQITFWNPEGNCFAVIFYPIESGAKAFLTAVMSMIYAAWMQYVKRIS